MAWRIEFSATATRQLGQVNRPDAARLVGYLRDRVARRDDPRQLGSALRGSVLGRYWRYRVGDYRLVCHLRDDVLVVLVVGVGHRQDVYRP